MGFLRTINKYIRSNSGTAILEFALVLPILVLLFSATVDVGYVMHQALVIQNIARDAARITALNKATDSRKGVDDTVRKKTVDNNPNKIQWDIQANFNPTTLATRSAGTQVEVKITCRTTQLTGLLAPLYKIILPEQLEATVMTRVE